VKSIPIVSRVARIKLDLKIRKKKQKLKHLDKPLIYEKKFSIFRTEEIVLLKIDINPRNSKFKNFKLLLNSSDLADIFQLEEFLNLLYQGEESQRILQKL